MPTGFEMWDRIGKTPREPSIFREDSFRNAIDSMGGID